MTPRDENSSIDPSKLLPRRSAGLKLILVCVLALLMSIPALFVYGVIAERTYSGNLAVRDVSALVGGEQLIIGPTIIVPYDRTVEQDGGVRRIERMLYIAPDTGDIQADVAVTDRRRGIYPVPVYEASIAFTGTIGALDTEELFPAGATPKWEEASLVMVMSDQRGALSPITATLGGQDLSMGPMRGPFSGPVSDRVSVAGARLGWREAPSEPQAFSLLADISGAQRLSFGPFAVDTSVTLRSDWDHPSFDGGFLPRRHNADVPDSEGFEASWRVSSLARGIPVGADATVVTLMLKQGSRDMGVRFIQLVSPYQSVERALKYAVMFIGFVFLAYFLFEMASGAKAHPAQYILVGLAQTIFYLLLLAFAERIGFDWAFLLAALMTVCLTAAYAMSVFRGRSYGLRAGGVLSGIYGLAYVLMRAEDYALIAGALISFGAIGLTMYVTRNIDWYGDRPSEPQPD